MNNNMSTSVKNFRDLIAWKKARSLQQQIYKMHSKLPYSEKDNLKSQILRSASSIAANIAEGSGQLYKKKEMTHYNIAIGSTSETRNWLNYALDCDYITQEEFNLMDNVAEEIIKMLFGLVRKIQKELNCLNNSLDKE